MSDTDFISASKLTSELPPEAEGAVQYLLIALAGREYGLRLDSLQEVLRFNSTAIAPLPNSPEWLEGVYSLRGTIISVVSLRLFLGLPRSDQYNSLPGKSELFGIGLTVPRLLVLHSDELVVGVVVDDIRGVLFTRPEELEAVEGADSFVVPYLEAAHRDPKTSKLTWLFDTRQLITSSGMLLFEPTIL